MYGRRQYEGGGTILRTALEDCRAVCDYVIDDPFVDDDLWGRKLSDKELERRRKIQLKELQALRRAHRYERLLTVLIQRLAVLRNQVVHGCVTYGPESKGWESLEAGLEVLRTLVPAFHKLMKQYGHLCAWDSVPYPRLGSDRHLRRGEIT